MQKTLIDQPLQVISTNNKMRVNTKEFEKQAQKMLVDSKSILLKELALLFS